ncbi:MAG: hypothetical protein LBG43_07765 [Treponema sp.]|nr:hypothetical protein [Treponema sp.]
MRQKTIALKRTSPYDETNFTHFRELLQEREGIAISCATLTAVLITVRYESATDNCVA